MKKTLSLLIFIAMIMVLVSSSVFAEEDYSTLDGFADAASYLSQSYKIDPVEPKTINVAKDLLVCEGNKLYSVDKTTVVDTEDYMIDAEKLAEALGGTAKYSRITEKLTISIGSDNTDILIPSMTSSSTSEVISNEPLVYGEIVAVPLIDTAEKLGATIEGYGDSLQLNYTYQTSRLIVKASEPPECKSALRIMGGYKNLYLYQFSSPAQAIQAQKELSVQPSVEYAEADAVLSTADSGSNDYSYLSSGPSSIGMSTLNDSLLENYNNDICSIPQIIVAVLDDGIDVDHSFLSGRLLYGHDFVHNDDDPNDEYSSDKGGGHGTHVAGIVVDSTLPNVKVMPLQVGEGKSVYCSLVIPAIEYAVSHGAKVLNMSFGGTGTYKSLEEAINGAYNNGVVSTVAAGNSSVDASGYYPANNERAITVSATIGDKINGFSRAYFSNYGKFVDVAAPGRDINSSYLNNEYKEMSGTSMAAPFAAAAAAGVYSFNPNSTAEFVTSALCQSVTDAGAVGKDADFGYGVLDMSKFSLQVWQAKIGSTKYDTLYDAVDNAIDGDTIEVPYCINLNKSVSICKNVTIAVDEGATIYRSDGYVGSLFTIEDGGNLTLDGRQSDSVINGGNLSGDSLIIVKHGGMLTVCNGLKISNNSCTGDGGAIKSSGSVYLNDVTISNVVASGSGDSIYSAGELNISGSVWIDNLSDIFLSSGCTITVPKALDSPTLVASITLPEGTSAGTPVCFFAQGLNAEKTRFKLNNPTLELVADGQALVTRTASANVARVGETEYSTLSQAINAVPINGVITLIKDVYIDSVININKSFTITSPGGYTIFRGNSFTNNDLINISSNSTLTLGSGELGEALTVSGGNVLVNRDYGLIYIPEYEDSSTGEKASGSLIINRGVTINDYLGVEPGTDIVYAGDTIYITAYSAKAPIRNYGSVTINGGNFIDLAKSTFSVSGIISNNNTLTINGGNFCGNSTRGPGLIVNNGQCNITGGIFSDTECKHVKAYSATGGIVYNNRTGSVKISGGYFQNNNMIGTEESPASGTCIANYGSLSIDGGVFQNNNGTYTKGGVIYNTGDSAALCIAGGTICSNSTDLIGGAIYTDGGTVSIGGTAEIYGNTSSNQRSNLSLAPGKYFTLGGDFTGVCYITSADGIHGGAKIGEADSKAYSLAGFYSDSGNVSAAYLSTDQQAPYDIIWSEDVDTVQLSGDLINTSTLTALVNGCNNIPDGLITFTWYYGNNSDGWTKIDGANGQKLVLDSDRYVGNYIKVICSGNGTGYSGSKDEVSSGYIRSVSMISVAESPTKTNYYVGDSIDSSGLILNVSYTDGSQDTVTNGYTCSPTTLSSSGMQTITVSYGNKITEFDISVADVKLTAIEVDTLPDKTTGYYINEPIEVGGLKLKATYNNGSENIISDGFFCSPIYFSDAGVHTVTVEYEGLSTEYSVTVDSGSPQQLCSGSCGENATWILYSSGVLEIKGTGNITSNSFGSYSQKIKSVIIDEGVNSIYRYVFSSCSNLVTVSIPSTVNNITEGVFSSCISLREINVSPNSDYYVVGENGALYNKYITSLIAFPAGSRESTVTVPDTVNNISDCAFYNCKNLQNLFIGSSVRYIGAESFNNCINLQTYTVKDENPYYSSIDGVLFNYDKTNLIKFPMGSEKPSYIIPDGVTTISETAFYYCNALKNIIISNSVTALKSSAFGYCSGLTDVTLSNSLTTIGDYAFSNCSGLTTVRIPNSVTTLGTGCFNWCTNLSKVIISENITSINSYAFYYCSELNCAVFLGNAPESLGNKAFDSTSSEFKINYLAGATGWANPWNNHSTVQLNLNELSINTYPNKTIYYSGDSLDTTGLTLTATYDTDITKILSSGFTCSPAELDELGTQAVSVNYADKLTSFDVSVRPSVGNINDDDVISKDDSIMLAQYLVGLCPLNSQAKTYSDTNFDGKITAIDSVRLAKYLNGDIQEFSKRESTDSSPNSDSSASIIVGEGISSDGVTIKFQVDIENNPGVAGFSFGTEYNSNLLTLVSIDKGDLLDSESGIFNSNPETGKVCWVDSKDIKGNGELFQLVFTLNHNAKIGDLSNISVKTVDDESTNIVNKEELPITYQVNNEYFSYNGIIISGISVSNSNISFNYNSKISGNGTAVAAFYENDRMVFCASTAVDFDQSTCSFNTGFSGAYEKAKLFIMNTDSKPLCNIYSIAS